MKKIIFSDYDGTLDTSEKDIIENIKAIQTFRNNGNLFVIATGRSYLDLKRKLNLYPIPFDYLILNHGGVILDKNEEVIDSCLISKEIVTEILDLVKPNKDVEKIVLFDALRKDIKETKGLTKIILEMKDGKSARGLSYLINQKWEDYTKSYVILAKEYNLVEIISARTDKGRAIEKILKMENICDKNVYTIGDGANDVSMIVKYNGYGMEKSEEAVLKATSKICKSVYELIKIIS